MKDLTKIGKLEKEKEELSTTNKVNKEKLESLNKRLDNEKQEKSKMEIKLSEAIASYEKKIAELESQKNYYINMSVIDKSMMNQENHDESYMAERKIDLKIIDSPEKEYLDKTNTSILDITSEVKPILKHRASKEDTSILFNSVGNKKSSNFKIDLEGIKKPDSLSPAPLYTRKRNQSVLIQIS